MVDERPREADAGAIDQCVEIEAVGGKVRVDHRRRLRFGDVHGNRQRLDLLLARDGRGRRLQGVGVARHQRNIVSGLGEAPGERKADAARSPRHHGDRLEVSNGDKRRFGRLGVTREPEVDEAAEQGSVSRQFDDAG